MHPAASYTYLGDTDWEERIRRAETLGRCCALCPRQCGVDRVAGQRGFCGADNTMRICGMFPHHGEEPPISGTRGSGTVFFSCCTLKCMFCQNYEISHEREGKTYTVSELARHMLALQSKGCHNINLVTPTHFLPWILKALRAAARDGLDTPIVYNCGGYERRATLEILDGIVDIYLPDMKYGDNGSAETYSQAPDYVEINREAVREMFRQVGPLRVDENGVADRGLIIRHLVLPNAEAGSESIRRFLVENFDPHDIAVSIMAQYRPLYRAHEYAGISRALSADEYGPVRDAFVRDGFDGFYQQISRLDTSFLIDFRRRKHDSSAQG